MIATTKLNVSSVSLMMTNMAVLWSPIISSSISSYDIISLSSWMSNGASLAPQEIKIDFAVLPAASLYLRYCLTAKCSGFSASSSSNNSSTAFLNSSSSSLVSLALINSNKVEKFCSSSGASYQMYPISAEYKRRSALTQKSSVDFSPSPLVFAIMVLTSFKMSFSLRI